MEGLLLLEAKGFLKKSKKYFFKLTENEIQYFKEDDTAAAKPEGAMSLDGAQVSGMVKAKQQFKISQGENVWSLQADTAELYQKWTDTLLDAIRRIQFPELAGKKPVQLGGHSEADADGAEKKPRVQSAVIDSDAVKRASSEGTSSSESQHTRQKSAASLTKSRTSSGPPPAESSEDHSTTQESTDDEAPEPKVTPRTLSKSPSTASKAPPDVPARTSSVAKVASKRTSGSEAEGTLPPPSAAKAEAAEAGNRKSVTGLSRAQSSAIPKSSPSKEDEIVRQPSKAKMAAVPESEEAHKSGGISPSSSSTNLAVTPSSPSSGGLTRTDAPPTNTSAIPVPADADRRTRIAYEILSTEKTYVDSLRLLVEIYQTQLKENGPAINLTPEQIGGLFPNCLDMVLNFNKELFAQLEKAILQENDTGKIGAIFIRLIPFLKMYNEYSSDYQNSLNNYNRLIKENLLFKPELDKCRASSRSKLTFEDLIIMPIQRVPRYNLLLSDLLSHTPSSHPDHSNIEAALKQVLTVAQLINESVRKSDNAKKIAALETKGANFDNLILPHRYLVREGQVKLKESGRQEARHFFLFNDILVHVNSSRLKGGIDLSLPEYTWPINLIWLRERVDKKGKKSGGYEIIGPNSILQLSKKTDASWIKDIQDGSDKWCQHINSNVDETANNGPSHRKGKYTFPGSGTYDGEWVDGQRQGSGSYSYLGSLYEGTWDQGKRSGKGKLFYATGHIYEGEFKNDQPHGKGSLTLGKEKIYVGEWVDGSQHGKGVMTFPNGDNYEGEFASGRMCGQGKYIAAKDGPSYEGQWKDDVYDGKGTLRYTAKMTYTGMFVAGLRHGQGQLKYPNGSVYTGEWKDDERHGKGEFKDVDGSVYDGEWKEDQPDGKGVKIFCNGTRYEGSWSRGIRKGQGTCAYKDGSRYDGHWADDRRHGQGTFTAPDGSVYTGEWAAGRRDGKGTMTYANGAKYEGCWSDDRYSKSGTYSGGTDDNVKHYEGEWQSHRMHGKGTVVFKNGDSYKGQFKDGRFHGTGTYTFGSGNILSGKWSAGVRDGKGQFSNPMEKSQQASGSFDQPNLLTQGSNLTMVHFPVAIPMPIAMLPQDLDSLRTPS